MAAEVTKKDLQSLQGWVNAKVSDIEKTIEKNDQGSRKMEGALIKRIDGLEDDLKGLDTKVDRNDDGARKMEGALIKRIDQLEARLASMSLRKAGSYPAHGMRHLERVAPSITRQDRRSG